MGCCQVLKRSNTVNLKDCNRAAYHLRLYNLVCQTTTAIALQSTTYLPRSIRSLRRPFTEMPYTVRLQGISIKASNTSSLTVVSQA